MKMFFEDSDYSFGVWKLWNGWQHYVVPDCFINSIKQDEDTGIVEVLFKKNVDLSFFLYDSISEKIGA